LLHTDPQVRRQCHSRYQHVLVDEFQDTNDLQRDIVFAITGFDDDSRPPDAPKLFVVGDAKQSIYGFRNADVRVFRHTRQIFREAPGDVRALALEVAFRSTASLTGYHNWLFDHESIMGTAEKPDYEARFEPLQAYRQRHPEGSAGEVLVTACEAVKDDSGEEKRPNAEQRREWEAATLAARLRELKESGFEVVDEDSGDSRPVQWGDMALLFRATSNINLYENALRRHAIPFYTIGGIGFWTRQEVMDLLNVIRVLNNFHDDLALAGVLRSPLFGFDDNELYRVARAGDTLFEGLQAVASGQSSSEHPDAFGDTISRAEWTVAKLQRFRMLSGILPLSRLLDRITDETGYSAAMAGQFGGERRIANIRKLVDVSRGFERDGNYGLDEFVRYVETLTEAEDREGEAALGRETADLVKLLTVHKAKGLEWPVVVIPDASRDVNARHGPIVQSTQFGVCPRYEDDERGKFAIGEMIREAEFSRELAEHRRLLYVAATRARDYLVISGAIDPERSASVPQNSWMHWVLEASGYSHDTVQSGQVTKDGWTVQLRVEEPAELPQPPREKKPLVERHAAKMRAGEPLEHQSIDADLRSRVRDIAVSACNLSRISVTALAAYRDCPLQYAYGTLDDIPAENSEFGLGRLSDGAGVMQLGTFAHRVLEVLGRSGRGGLDKAIETARKAPDMYGRLSNTQIAEVRGWLVDYLTSDIYVKIVAQSSHLRSEAGITFQVSGVEIEGKVDALVESNDAGRHLIDYKTGRSGEQNRSKYVFQIGLYCEGVRRSLGELPETATLMYLTTGEPVRLEPKALAEKAVDEAQVLLDAIKNDVIKHQPGDVCNTCQYSWACRHCAAAKHRSN
ncbi:MAG: UvrD-helicase domain-containing protein, partial [Armatimonadota bacterium]